MVTWISRLSSPGNYINCENSTQLNQRQKVITRFVTLPIMQYDYTDMRKIMHIL